jgi:hypothetical protein
MILFATAVLSWVEGLYRLGVRILFSVLHFSVNVLDWTLDGFTDGSWVTLGIGLGIVCCDDEVFKVRPRRRGAVELFPTLLVHPCRGLRA